MSSAQGGDGDWLAKVDDEVPISRITLPGTHDSGALIEPFPGTAKTQTASISEQLEFGVRLLDIRCRHVNDLFQIHHGMVNQEQSFGELLESVIHFLRTHPSEVVVMSINQEFVAKDNTRKFEETLDDYLKKDRDRWFLKSRIPRLGEVRGKIVLLRRFARSSPLGLDASRWPDNRSFSENGLSVQDEYRVADEDRKWRRVVEGFEAARESVDPAVIHLNFTSGVASGVFGKPDITRVSDAINPKLADYLEKSKQSFFGWVMMDFASAGLVRQLYRKNFLAEGVPPTP